MVSYKQSLLLMASFFPIQGPNLQDLLIIINCLNMLLIAFVKVRLKGPGDNVTVKWVCNKSVLADIDVMCRAITNTARDGIFLNRKTFSFHFKRVRRRSAETSAINLLRNIEGNSDLLRWRYLAVSFKASISLRRRDEFSIPCLGVLVKITGLYEDNLIRKSIFITTSTGRRTHFQEITWEGK